MRTPLPTWLRSWLWYLVSIGWSSPKKTKTAAIVRARGVRFSRSHSRRHRFIDRHVIDDVAIAISGSLDTCAGQGEERRFQVGGHRLAGNLAGTAAGDHRGDPALAGLEADGVHPDGVGTDRLGPGGPRLAGQCRGHRVRVTGDADQPAWLQVGVDEVLGGPLVEQPAIAQDAHLVGDLLHV